MSYRLNDPNGKRTVEEAKKDIKSFTLIEQTMKPIFEAALKVQFGPETTITDYGVDNSGEFIEDDAEFHKRGGGNFDWEINFSSGKIIADAQVHTVYCPCITLKVAKLKKAIKNNWHIFVICCCYVDAG
jgi:hypothetical protein